ncbi:MAG: glycosyltransferase family 4 protein [Nitrospirae bacterium]|nr:MAG: glycosyltransferase family 4 protein [Nitrospirota bacterium]
MNILLLAEVSASAVLGGAERVLREQALGLRKRGHEVSIVARAPAGDPRPQVTVSNLVERRYAVSRRTEPAFVLSSLVRSVKAFDEASALISPDAVIIHQSLAGFGAILRRRAQARQWIYMCLSLAHEEYLSRTPPTTRPLDSLRRTLNATARRWIERVVMNRCARVLVLSQFMWQRVLAVHRIPEDKLGMVTGAADPHRFRPPEDPVAVREQLKLPLNRVVLFTVRNLVPRMGLENLLQAISILGEEGRDLLLVIGGEGPLRPALEQLIRDLGHTDRARLVGFIAEDDLSKYYQAADLVLMPTHQLEGFGLVTVEALACGTPVLGTPVGAIPEVLARVDPGLLADGTDSTALAIAIRRLLRQFRDQPGEQERLSMKGRALVEQDYTWDRHSDQLNRVLREVRPTPAAS